MNYKCITHLIKNKRFFVYKINSIWYRERSFCILDKKLPFELFLKYKESNIAIGFLFDTFEHEKYYNFRFATREECLYNLDSVKKKKEIIDEMLVNFNNDSEFKKTTNNSSKSWKFKV